MEEKNTSVFEGGKVGGEVLVKAACKSERWQWWLLWASAIVAYYVVFQLFYNMVAEKQLLPYSSMRDLLQGVAMNFTLILVTYIMNYLVVFCLVRHHIISIKMAIDAVTSFVLMIFLNLLFLFVVSQILGHKEWAVVDWAGTVFNNFFILLGVEVTYYVLHFKRTLRQKEEAQLNALQYQYDALKAQVNPHFLFNSLNILNSLVAINPEKSREFIGSLSQTYRYVMAQQGRDTITLREELDFLRAYVRVLTIRYNDKFEVCVSGEECIASQTIIPYTLQLLIENVTKHNVISAKQPMRVDVTIGDGGLTITNPIRPRPANSASHFGLDYLDQLYSAHGRHFYTENDGVSFTAHVPYIYHL